MSSFSHSTLTSFLIQLGGPAEAVIQPIHKKGDINSPDNYRGISVLNVSAKLYSYILNNHLTTWLEDNTLTSETGCVQTGLQYNRSYFYSFGLDTETTADSWQALCCLYRLQKSL